MSRPVTLLLVLLTLLLHVRGAGAMVYVATDLPALASDARAIAVGRVVAVESRWTAGRRNIETLVTLQVSEYLKGDLGREVTVRVPGGQIGPYLSVMPGAPRLVEGDRVVLFLAGQPPELPHILALGQGVFHVVADRATLAQVIVPEPLTAVAEPGDTVVRGNESRRRTPFARFAAEVRALATRGAGR
jgi:hypothetical protein